MLLESQSSPSYNPSPEVAHVLWIYLRHRINQYAYIEKKKWRKRGEGGGNCGRRGTIYLTSVADEGSEDQAYQLSQQHSLH